MKPIKACSPDSNNFLDPDILTPVVEAYRLDKDSEAVLARHSLKEKEMDNLSDVIHQLHLLKSAFPTLFKLLHIAFTNCF